MERLFWPDLFGLVLFETAYCTSFFCISVPAIEAKPDLKNDTILFNNKQIDGKGIDTAYSLKQLQAYQEFWHSWRTFNPATKK